MNRKNGATQQTESPSPEKEQLTPGWEDTYAELRNKLRWAIGSTVAESGVTSLPFRAQTALAAIFAADMVELLKSLYEKPNLRIDRDNARELLRR